MRSRGDCFVRCACRCGRDTVLRHVPLHPSRRENIDSIIRHLSEVFAPHDAAAVKAYRAGTGRLPVIAADDPATAIRLPKRQPFHRHFIVLQGIGDRILAVGHAGEKYGNCLHRGQRAFSRSEITSCAHWCRSALFIFLRVCSYGSIIVSVAQKPVLGGENKNGPGVGGSAHKPSYFEIEDSRTSPCLAGEIALGFDARQQDYCLHQRPARLSVRPARNSGAASPR